MRVFGLSGGEIFIVAFVTIAVVSARYWPAVGERVAVRLGGGAIAREPTSTAKTSVEAPRDEPSRPE